MVSWKMGWIRPKVASLWLRVLFAPLKSVITQLRKSFVYDGRASRSDFWWWNLFLLISLISLTEITPTAGAWLFLLSLPVTLSLQVRRIHDVGHSGRWLLIPPVAWWFCLRRSDLDTNRWGAPLRKNFIETVDTANVDSGEKVVFARASKDVRCLVLDNSDFSDENLHGFDFSGSSLLQSDFSRARQVSPTDEEQPRPVQFFGCDLVDARFVGCELSGANFCASDLRGADFSGAELINADFRCADLRGVNFQHSNLNGADFLGSKLLNAKFTGASIARSMSMELDGHEFA